LIKEHQVHGSFMNIDLNRSTYPNAVVMSCYRANVRGRFCALLYKSLGLYIPGSVPKPSIQLKDMPLSAEDIVRSILINMVLFIK